MDSRPKQASKTKLGILLTVSTVDGGHAHNSELERADSLAKPDQARPSMKGPVDNHSIHVGGLWLRKTTLHVAVYVRL